MHSNVIAGKRVLVVTPSFPAPESGAEQLDRAEGMRQLKRLGYQVRVIAKAVEWADRALIRETAARMGIEVRLVPYRYSNRTLSLKGKLQKFFGKFLHPLYLDGAAYEYAEPEIKKVLQQELDEFRPDIVWFEYTYLWPLYKLARPSGARVVTRSLNFEPEHFLYEEGRSLFNYLKYIPKFFSERTMVRGSDVVLAITPQEAKIYKDLGAKEVDVLPLRGLGAFTSLPRPEIRNRAPLHVFFMGSSYRVVHNLAAVSHIIKEIAPRAEALSPGAFVFHIFGGKLPDDLQKLCDGVRIVHEGYVKNLDEKLGEMDIALVPSLMGAGMQQKVFEPLTRGIPTITSPRAIAGYALQAGAEYIAADTADEFVSALLKLRNVTLRQSLCDAASQKTAMLFSQKALDATIQKAIYDCLTHA